MASNEKEMVKEPEEKAAVKKDEKKVEKKKKVSIFKRIAQFFRELKAEMKKIVWFGRKQTINSTILVIVSIVVSSLVISMLDYGFSNALMFLGRII